MEYTIKLPSSVYGSLQAIAALRGMTVDALVKQFITLGFVADSIDADPNARLVLHDANGEREIKIYQ